MYSDIYIYYIIYIILYIYYTVHIKIHGSHGSKPLYPNIPKASYCNGCYPPALLDQVPRKTMGFLAAPHPNQQFLDTQLTAP